MKEYKAFVNLLESELESFLVKSKGKLERKCS
jgi:hypothetical protein